MNRSRGRGGGAGKAGDRMSVGDLNSGPGPSPLANTSAAAAAAPESDFGDSAISAGGLHHSDALSDHYEALMNQTLAVEGSGEAYKRAFDAFWNSLHLHRELYGDETLAASVVSGGGGSSKRRRRKKR